MPAEVFTSTEQGFAVVGLRTSHAELAMVPALGGRIIGLCSRRTGRQWCWHQPRADWLWANRPGDDFGQSPQAGIDECLPSVAACTHNGRAIADHGELWTSVWTLDSASLARGELDATVPLRSWPFVFRRTITDSDDGGFVFRYRVTNLSQGEEDLLWSWHPLFAIHPGDRLELPAEVTSLRLNGGLGDRPISFGDHWAYPEPFAGVRLDRLEVPGMPQGCVKGFAGPLSQGGAAVVNDETGDRVVIGWDATAIPYCGLWLNRGHAGFHHVAIEPCTGAPDALSDAVTIWRQFGRLGPRQSRDWHLAVHVS